MLIKKAKSISGVRNCTHAERLTVVKVTCLQNESLTSVTANISGEFEILILKLLKKKLEFFRMCQINSQHSRNVFHAALIIQCSFYFCDSPVSF